MGLGEVTWPGQFNSSLVTIRMEYRMRSTRHRHFENKHYSVIFKTRLVEIESLSIEAQLITALSNGEKRYLNERISIHKKFIYQRNSDLRWPEERLLGFSEVLTNLRRIRKENHLFVDERIELISCNIPVGQQLCQGLYPNRRGSLQES